MVNDRLNSLRFVPVKGTAGACPICSNPTVSSSTAGDARVIACAGCGTYRISGTALAMCDTLSPRQRVLVSGFARDSLLAGARPEIHSSLLEEALAWPMPSLRERATRMLRWAVALLEF